MQIVRNRTQYDVCVVGSGAGGGMAAMVLSQAGANVVMLEPASFVEVQGTGEHGTFNRDELGTMLDLAQDGIGQLFRAQRAALGW